MKKSFVCGEWMEKETGQVFSGVAELQGHNVVKVHVPEVPEGGPVLRRHVRDLYKNLREENKKREVLHKEENTKPWMGVEVTDVRKINGDGKIRAFADVKFEVAGDAEFESFLLVKGFTILEGNNGLFVTMPKKASPDGSWYEVIDPDKALRSRISNEVLDAYKKFPRGNHAKGKTGRCL